MKNYMLSNLFLKTPFTAPPPGGLWIPLSFHPWMRGLFSGLHGSLSSYSMAICVSVASLGCEPPEGRVTVSEPDRKACATSVCWWNEETQRGLRRAQPSPRSLRGRSGIRVEGRFRSSHLLCWHLLGTDGWVGTTAEGGNGPCRDCVFTSEQQVVTQEFYGPSEHGWCSWWW
jgi:hypothetical protein